MNLSCIIAKVEKPVQIISYLKERHSFLKLTEYDSFLRPDPKPYLVLWRLSSKLKTCSSKSSDLVTRTLRLLAALKESLLVNFAAWSRGYQHRKRSTVWSRS